MFKESITITPDVEGDEDSLNGIKKFIVKDDAGFPTTGSGGLAIWVNEDKSFNLSDLLTPSFDDLDGSESRWISLEGLAEGTTVVVNGKTLTAKAGESLVIDKGDLGDFGDGKTTTISGQAITITPPKDFSGDMQGVKVTLHAKDSDSDSNETAISEVTADVTLDIYVYPQGGDTEIKDVTGEEDEGAIKFLEHLKVSDETTSHERITEISFKLPESWVNSGTDTTKWIITEPTVDVNWKTEIVDGSYVIKTTSAGETAGFDLQTILKDFTVTPPDHSSMDQTLNLTVTTADKDTVAGELVEKTNSSQHELSIEVTPVAEVIPDTGDQIGADDGDLRMTKGHDYTTLGAEDAWFDFNQETGFDLKDRWHNADGRTDYGQHENGDNTGSEDTYALLTPVLLTGTNQESAYGSKFTWIDSNNKEQTVIFGGEPIEVPVAYLDTLKFMAKPGFSGMFQIKVQAKTKDYGDDENPLATPVEDISGEAWLKNVLIEPRAGAVSADITPRVTGDEGTEMLLSIRPKKSGEDIFDLTLSGVPEGVTIKYGDTNYIAGGDGTVTIKDFDSSKDLTITPPEMSNDDFDLGVQITSKDILWLTKDGTETGEPLDKLPSNLTEGGKYGKNADGKWYIEHTNADFTSKITVAPKGVADGVEASGIDWKGGLEWSEAEKVATGATFTEEAAEAGISLSSLIGEVTKKDNNDTSETLTYKVTLPAGITLIDGGTPLVDNTWSLTEAELGTAKLVTPNNYKGDLNFTFHTTTTENDGDSLTQDWPISVQITPSPESTINLTDSMVEDEYKNLSFAIDNSADEDEQLTAVWIDFETLNSNITLYYKDGETYTKIDVGNAFDGASWNGNELKLAGNAIGNIHAKYAENQHSGEITAFKVSYEITDTVGGDMDTAVSKESGPVDYKVTVAADTDQPTLGELADITANAGNTEPVIKLSIGNDGGDYDGSEQVVRVILEGVPDGVVIQSTADYTADFSGNSWTLVPKNGNAIKKVDGANTELDITFKASAVAGKGTHDITVTVMTEDANNGDIKTVSKNVSLTTDFTGDDDGEDPAEITTWTPTDFKPTEDAEFTLDKAIDAQLGNAGANNGFTITLTNVPEGTTVVGMTPTTVEGGTTYWTVSGQGGNDELKTLLETIEVKPPKDFNSGAEGAGTKFEYTATLTTHANGKRREKEAEMKQAVKPVTDDAKINISAEPVEEGTPVDIAITVDNTADTDWTLVDGKIYVKLTPETRVGEGTVTYNGNTIEPLETGIYSGYYELTVDENWKRGDTVNLEFRPTNPHARGNIGIEVKVNGKEAGSTVVKETVSTGSTAVINQINDGYKFTVGTNGAVTGTENQDGEASSAIALELGAGHELIDGDNEEVYTVQLRGVPNDFLVYVDDVLLTPETATNTGGSGTNTWLIDPSMLDKISILPPQHWSGTITGMELVVVSGEVKPYREDKQEITLEVTPLADGITLNPNPSFGDEGKIIDFNLNADFIDAKKAGDTDQSTETATLQIKGLGEHTGFYIGEQLIGLEGDGYSIERTEGEDGIYTITGLSQEDLSRLGFIQADNDIADTLEVRARTVESGDPNEPSKWSHADDAEWAKIETTINKQFATGGEDTLLWTGGLIDGRGGDDTIQLRFGEKLDGNTLATQLDNIEVISMVGNGANSITSLSVEDVLNMTDDRNILKILGDAEDSIELIGDWDTGTVEGSNTVYTGTHDGQEIKLEVNTIIID